MFVSFDKPLSEMVRKLSHKIGIGKKHIIRLAISDMAAFFLDSPQHYIVFEREEWERTLAKINADIKRKARRKQERNRRLEAVSRN